MALLNFPNSFLRQPAPATDPDPDVPPRKAPDCSSLLPSLGINVAAGLPIGSQGGKSVLGFYGETGISLRLFPLPGACEASSGLGSCGSSDYGTAGLVLESSVFADYFANDSGLVGGRFSLRGNLPYGFFLKGGPTLTFFSTQPMETVGFHGGLGIRFPYPYRFKSLAVGLDLDALSFTLDFLRPKGQARFETFSHLSLVNTGVGIATLIGLAMSL